MRKILLLLFLLSTPAFAADNALTVTVGSGLTMRTIDVGSGVQSSGVNLVNTSGASILGTAGTANTSVLTIQGIASGTVVPVSLTSTTITGTVAATQSGTWNIGTVTTLTGITNPVTVAQATAANLNATVVGTGTFAVQAAQSGTWTEANSAAILSAIQGSIPAGSAIIGKVGIDQTTPGTTNGVALVGVNGATILAGNGATGTGSPRVTIASDNTAFAVNAQLQYGTTATVDSPCKTVALTYTPVSITTATTTRIITPVSAKKTYICGFSIQTAAANNIGIVEGTGGTCGSSTAGVYGGTTAGSGLNLAANQGIAWGNGESAVMSTAGTNVDFCLITSAATNLAGHIAWVQK